MVVGFLVLLASGCTTVGSSPLQLSTAQLASAQLPSPQLNPDLWKPLLPSNDRDWSPEQAVLAYAEVDGDRITVHNVRNCDYRTPEDFTVEYDDRTFDLRTVESVDFIMVPFSSIPGVGHTMLSFGFSDRRHLAVSVETRKEKGESYGPLKGFFRQYEIIYVVADERDVIGLRANHWLENVYVYRTRATPEQSRALLTTVMQRVNKLVDRPEFYHTLTNNCTTNIVRHINQLSPGLVQYDYRVLLPGYSDQLAYELGLLDTDSTFEQTKLHARVNYPAYVYRDSPDFSEKIRR